MSTPELVVIGCSAGGLSALELLLAALPAQVPFAILIVQHRSPHSDVLCDVLQNVTPHTVTEVLDKEPVTPGTIYLAPPDYHVLVEAGEFQLSNEEPVRFARPSIDVTFVSAADSYTDRVAAFVLTGANEDGAAGAQRIWKRGGRVFVQDPKEAEVPRMPAAAVAATPAATVLPLKGLAEALRALALEPRTVRSA